MKKIMQKPPKIVFFDFAVAVGGSIVVLFNTLKSLNREKYAPIVVTSLPDARAREIFGGLSLPIVTYHHLANYVARFVFLERPIFRVRWRKRMASYLFSAYSAFANCIPFLLLFFRILRLRPTLIHTHNGIDSMVIASFLRIPAVLHLHGPFGLNSNLEVAIAKKAKACVCVSQGVADILLSKGVNAERVFVLPNPSPVPAIDESAAAAYRKKFNQGGDRVLVAHVGRLVPWKGQLEFLQAFALIEDRLPNVTALVVGDDVEKLNEDYVCELHAFVANHGLSDKVFFTGHIGDIHNLMATVDVLVHSSTEPEPFGLVVTEAMVLGKAVIAASYGATVEIVEDNISGVLANPHNRQELADAILRIADDSALRQRLGAGALAKVERDYSVARYQAGLENIYEWVLAQ